MTRIEGHPPPANYGPEINLPTGYRDHWSPWCPDCEQSVTGTCTTCTNDLRADETELWAQIREETGHDL